MNEQIFFDLGQQKYSDDVARGEANHKRQADLDSTSAGPRFHLAVALLSLAARIQPSLSIQVQRPAQVATV